MSAPDAVAQFEAASVAGDIDALVGTLAPNAELISPLGANFVIRGHADLRVLLGAIYSTIHDLQWGAWIGDDRRVVMTGHAKVGPLRIGDAVIVDIAADGSIERLQPHLRPWLATTLFALVMMLKMGRHPGLLQRSWPPADARVAA